MTLKVHFPVLVLMWWAHGVITTDSKRWPALCVTLITPSGQNWTAVICGVICGGVVWLHLYEVSRKLNKKQNIVYLRLGLRAEIHLKGAQGNLWRDGSLPYVDYSADYISINVSKNHHTMCFKIRKTNKKFFAVSCDSWIYYLPCQKVPSTNKLSLNVSSYR